ncbi:MAG: quinolinate synthase NadA [Oscillospiraceae bacterium]|nr:quinolinate synthase NadA [Oscillospiraceae bacterium]
MKISEIQDKIIKLKKEHDICVLAHSYQAREIIEVADYAGDSYQLSVAASKATNKTVLMCGVRFMAETVKILSPQKKVILANPTAGCPMAEQMDKELISGVKKQFPDYTVVAYINTTAALKTICDVCVTSSSAVKIVERIENDKILFLPDCNLGAYVQSQLPHKEIKLLQGGCPIHAVVDVEDVKKAKSLYPDSLILVHPECVPEVVALADYVGSTSGIMEFATKSDAKSFLIGTEMSIAEHLQYTNAGSGKRFHCLSQKLLCPNMKITTLLEVLGCVSDGDDFGEEIILDDETVASAKSCIDKMIELGD